ncbi:8-amino-7-oxononanoate synthase [Synechococcus sp. PCC 7502]|nr:8-amino-7-oxononanoate synthase [Synechococcus sp. PCC 7502]
MTSSYDWIDAAIATIKKANWYRSPQTPQPSMLMFASNNYLGLAQDQRLIDAAIAATQKYGAGATGSRLVSGHLEIHDQLEQAIAKLKGTESSLVFSSGYLANLGTISALVGARDLILADAYNHSCLKQGAILSGAKVIEYIHRNHENLCQQLKENRSHHRRCLIITDTVFSMDGDICPLKNIVDLAQEFECMVLVDEAHATGVFGDHGGGVVSALGVTYPIIQVGTLSKALGSLGGYVAGSAKFIDYLKNRASTWIYTTGLSPGDTAAALKAVEIVQTEPQLRQNLWANVKLLKTALTETEISILPTTSQILAITVGDTKKNLAISQYLNTQNIFAPAIRPPTVPTPRIRLTLMATHTSTEIQTLVSKLKTAIHQLD